MNAYTSKILKQNLKDLNINKHNHFCINFRILFGNSVIWPLILLFFQICISSFLLQFKIRLINNSSRVLLKCSKKLSCWFNCSFSHLRLKLMKAKHLQPVTLFDLSSCGSFLWILVQHFLYQFLDLRTSICP